MKLSKAHDYNDNPAIFDVREAADYELSESWSDGQIEVVKEHVENNRKMLSKLIGILHSNGALKNSDILTLLPNFKEAP